jgi:chromosomal replication initiator protein
MWIEPLEFVSNDSYGFVLSTPNLYSKKRILSNYKHVIETEIKNIIGQTHKLKIDVAECKPVSKVELKVETQRNLPFDDKKPNLHGGRQLQRNFTFDQFVVGDNNNFAYSAALALASRKSAYQNALFLFSDIGLGKSHLSQSIGHHIMAKYPDERVFYITAEDFTNEMVFAFKNGTIDRFKQKYRNNCDVLLLEDVHHLSGKERTQIELALTLDTLFEAQKKIIFSSCHLPADIPKLSDKLKSRLTSGLISTIEPPNFRTRVRILNKKSQLNGYKIPPDITRYLASELITDIRQLDSQLRNLGAGHFQINALILHPGKIHLLNSVHGVETLSDLAGDLMHFRHGKPIAPKGDGGHRRIPEGIIHHRSDGAFRQFGNHIVHFVAQQFPGRREVF